jgi:uncharacterized protein (UPF0276 family)
MMMNAKQTLDRRNATGIGFRTPHYADIIASRPAVGFFEVHAENYLCGGPRLRQLESLRADWPISVHGVGLSMGSAEGVDPDHLARFVALVERIDPVLVSEHLAWTVIDGIYLNDLLPLPYTEEALETVSRNVSVVQDRLRRPILIENPSRYLRFAGSTVPEADFLAELAQRTGCGLLCDVNNIHVSCANLGGDPYRWLESLPAAAVGEVHLAGHAVNNVRGSAILIDDHGSRVAPAVWELYDLAVQRFPNAPALIEWDSNLPNLSVLIGEAVTADRRRADILLENQHAYAA